MEFRRKAVQKLEAPEQLDLPVRLATSRGWVALVVIALAMAAGLVWACVASIARVTHADGIITNPQGSFPVQSPVAGQITKLSSSLAVGRTVRAGSAAAIVTTTDQRQLFIDAGVSGRVTAVLVRPGQVIGVGTTLAVTEPVDDDGPAAVLYVPTTKAAGLRTGDATDLVPQDTPQSAGKMRGTIASIDTTAESRQEIAAFLGDEDLAVRFTHGTPSVKVVVRLPARTAPDGATAPSFPPRTLVTATIRLGSTRPIDLVTS